MSDNQDKDRNALYAEFEATWLAELQPRGLTESEWARSFIHATWLKHRVIDAQNQVLASSKAANVASLSGDAAKTFNRLHRLEGNYSRRANFALKELRKLKADREEAENAAARRGIHLVVPGNHSKLVH